MNYIQGNSNISHTYHIYLDSDSGQKSGNVFQFPISPTIEVQFPERGNLYLKEFSGINNLYNVNAKNQTNSITVGATTFTSGTSGVPEIPIGNYSKLQDLVDQLNTSFQTASSVEFSIVDDIKVQAKHPVSTTTFSFSGLLFEKMLRFTVNELVPTPHVSKGEVDIHRATHNIYMSVAEVTNNTRDVGTAAGKGNRIAKIPIATEFGAYVLYQAVEPVQKSPVENSLLNQLNIQLFDDDGNVYEPDRFTITLALEIAVPVSTDYKNHISEMPGSYSTSKLHPIIAPAIHRSC